MDPTLPSISSLADVSLLIALVLVTAKVGGELAARLGQPPVLGELMGGMALGNLPLSPLHGSGAHPSVDLLAGLGALILLFQVGVESTVRGVLEVGVAAARVAVLGTVGTFAAGWVLLAALAPSLGLPSRVFLAASLTATSIGISARVLKDLGRADSKDGRTILGAAVIDDVIALVVLAMVTGWVTDRATGAAASPWSFLWILAKTLGFLGVSIALGVLGTPRLFAGAARLRTPGAQLGVALALCFFMAWAASLVGLAPLVGAFAAGLVLEERHSAAFVARGERSLEELLQPLSSFLVPIFFVVMGLRADLRVLVGTDTFALLTALLVAAVAGKAVCALGAARGADRTVVALGMMPRGEVTLIFASLGLTLVSGGAPLLDRRAYSALVAVVVATTLLTPTLLERRLRRAALS